MSNNDLPTISSRRHQRGRADGNHTPRGHRRQGDSRVQRHHRGPARHSAADNAASADDYQWPPWHHQLHSVGARRQTGDRCFQAHGCEQLNDDQRLVYPRPPQPPNTSPPAVPRGQMTRPGDAAQPTPTRIRLPRHRHKTAATKTTRPHQRAAPRPRRSTQHWGQTPQEIAGPKNRDDGHPAMCAHTQWAWAEECLELLPDWPRVELCAVRSAATYPHGHLAAVRNLSTTDRAYGGRRPCSTAESAGGIAGAYGCEGANVVVASCTQVAVLRRPTARYLPKGFRCKASRRFRRCGSRSGQRHDEASCLQLRFGILAG